MSRKTFLYIRVSTLDQVGGAESQARALNEWCARNNIIDFETFTDHGISGAKESRPALDKMMERVKNLEAEQVIVFAFSRFARSTMHLLKGLQIFKDCKTRFVSITEQIDTESSMGVAMFTLTGQSIPLINGIEYNVSIVIDPEYTGPLKFTPFPQKAEDYL
jgi:DNA invertase Pin-like site-specific DNA recombinase